MYTVIGVIGSRVSEKTYEKEGKSNRICEYVINIEGEGFIVAKAFNNLNDEINEGCSYAVKLSIKSREYNGKYYTDVMIRSVTLISGEVKDKFDEIMGPEAKTEFSSQMPQETNTDYASTPFAAPGYNPDDLPF